MVVRTHLIAWSWTVAMVLGAVFSSESAWAYSKEACKSEYVKALKDAREAKRQGEAPRIVSHIYAGAAARCRDFGGVALTVELFDKAVKADPKNAHALRLYGDYLMGYRGLYEYAAVQYFRALEVVTAEPKAFDFSFKRSLERSFEILHRDGKNGVPLFTSKPLAAFLNVDGRYFRLPKPHVTQGAADGSLQQLAEDKLPRVAANTDNQAALGDLQGTARDVIVRNFQDWWTEGDLTLRSAYKWAPYLRVGGEFRTGKNLEIDPEALNEPLERTFSRLEVILGKNLLLGGGFDLNLEAEVAWTQLLFDNQVTGDRIQDEDSLHYGGRFTLGYNFGYSSLKLTGGLNAIDIENFDSNDDDGLNYSLALRLSSFTDPEVVALAERFRGRRSTHLEVGFIRTARNFRSNDPARRDQHLNEVVYRPFLSYEEFGLFKGFVDVLVNYEWRRQFNRRGGQLSVDGAVEGHVLTLVPAWVPVFKLYNQDFWEGVEFASVELPIEFAFGDGFYRRIGASLRGQLRYTTPWGFAVKPAISIGFTRYTDLDLGDFTALLQLGLGA